VLTQRYQYTGRPTRAAANHCLVYAIQVQVAEERSTVGRGCWGRYQPAAR